MVLIDESHRHVMRTSCKTWRCHACSKKLARLYQLRMEYGTSELGECFVITVTYEMGSRKTVDARGAVMDLRKLWQRLRSRPRWKSLAWCRVTELTKKGQVHYHLIVGGVTGKGRCEDTTYSRNKGYVRWYRRGCQDRGEECINHELAREWERITVDSYVVDVDPVRSGRAVAGYLGKYLTKAMATWDTLEGLGFKRRWNCSRNWPSPGRMRLAGSKVYPGDESAWEQVIREVRTLPYGPFLGSMSREAKRAKCEHTERVGIDLSAPFRRKAMLRKATAMLRKGQV